MVRFMCQLVVRFLCVDVAMLVSCAGLLAYCSDHLRVATRLLFLLHCRSHLLLLLEVDREPVRRCCWLGVRVTRCCYTDVVEDFVLPSFVATGC